MMFKIPPRVFQIPDNALWAILGGIASILLASFLAYRLGVHSQAEAAKREARVKALGIIDGVCLRIVAKTYSPDSSLHRQLEKTVVEDLSVRLSRRKRASLQLAWQQYQKHPEKDTDPIIMMDSLVDLRKAVDRA